MKNWKLITILICVAILLTVVCINLFINEDNKILKERKEKNDLSVQMEILSVHYNKAAFSRDSAMRENAL